MNLTKTLKLAGLAGALLISGLSFGSASNVGDNDVAIHGYDPVAYFRAHKPVLGSAEHTATHEGAIYRFSSEKNRDLFKSNPEHYAPQFGGYCAMGVALNKKLDVDPDAFHISDNKLYLNLNKAVQKKWLTDVSGHVTSATRIWDGIEELPVALVNAED